MKLTSLVLVLSAVSLNVSHAEDAVTRNGSLAQQASPAKSGGACTPIGLTANGEIVFPWECRETIEKQRGPVAVKMPAASDTPPVQPSASRDVQLGGSIAANASTPPVVTVTTDHVMSPAEPTAAPTPPKSPVRRGQLSDVHHNGPQMAPLPLRPAVGGAVRPKKKDTVALQNNAPQR